MSTPVSQMDPSEQSHPQMERDQSSTTSDIPLDFTEEEKASTTYWVTEKMSHHPWESCCTIFLTILMVVIIVVAAGMGGITTASEYDWNIASSTESKNNDALADAIDHVDLVGGNSTERTQIYNQQQFFVYTSVDGSDLYTPENIQSMCSTESTLALNDNFPSFCRLNDLGKCELPMSSIVVYFYGFQNISQWNCTLLNSTDVNTKKQVIYDAIDSAEGREQYGLWLSKDATSKGYTTKTESVWYFGAPLAGYESMTDRSDDQV